MSASRGKAVFRRFLLTAAVAAQLPAKVSKATAEYQDTPKGGMSCKVCTFFRRPDACQVVDGDIHTTGWCKLFDLPD